MTTGSTVLLLALLLGAPPAPDSSTESPWRAVGLDDREAAAHALDRLAYGARPGEVDRVLAMGLDRWIEAQIAASFEEPILHERLADLDALSMTSREMVQAFPPPGAARRLLREKRAAALEEARSGADEAARRRARREAMTALREAGARPLHELIEQLMANKVLRAAVAENQLHEVLSDFWFNHFNVSRSDNQVRPWLLAYERDAIRPHVAGGFRELLGATARHPAMLHYLDNSDSRADPGAETGLDRVARELELRSRHARGPGAGRDARRGGVLERAPFTASGPRALAARRAGGLNENYARELMELHTLGVDGGYTEQDVVEVARAFTGWTALPPVLPEGMSLEGPLESTDPRRRRLARSAGFVIEGDFLFHPGFHDDGPKTILGERLPAGGGVEDGEHVLDRLAAHPATAHHLARKLAVRFVSDQPTAALVERLAQRWIETDGDLPEVLRVLFASEDFWSSGEQKIKSPFELAVSAVRATGARVTDPRGLVEWVARMGQPLYAHQAPTGYADVAESWVNSGALLNRMRFGLELAQGHVDGVELSLRRFSAAGDEATEPPSWREALARWGATLLPERELEATLDLLEPVAARADLAGTLAQATRGSADGPRDALLPQEAEQASQPPAQPDQPAATTDAVGFSREQVVGLLLGSPQFQRR